ncbi:MAG: PilZ domain-containing protein [Desulfobacteraceae bacterium]|jgi:hypothetical protein|nr:MAG: PilZ domain-containing protein [Desulfobacteraceae bacterium]
MTFVSEKRRCPRIATENRVVYILFNEELEKIDRGIGRTLNLSQTGVLLETEKKLIGTFVLLLTIDLEGKKIKVRGKVVTSRYCNDSGCFFTGVEFIGPKDEQLEAIKAFVKIYTHRKYNANDRKAAG